jgi:hypothetical protein
VASQEEDVLADCRSLAKTKAVFGERDSVVLRLRETSPANITPEPFSISLTFPDSTPDAPYV